MTNVPYIICEDLMIMMLRFSNTKLSKLYNYLLNSLTAMVSYMRPLFFELRASLITFRIFVRCQRLIARNVAELFSSNRGVSHFYAACRINELSRGSVSGPKIK